MKKWRRIFGSKKVVDKISIICKNDPYSDYEIIYYDDGSFEKKFINGRKSAGWGFNYNLDWKSSDFKTKGWGSSWRWYHEKINYDISAEEYNKRYCRGCKYSKAYLERLNKKQATENEVTKIYNSWTEQKRMWLASSYRTFREFVEVHGRWLLLMMDLKVCSRKNN